MWRKVPRSFSRDDYLDPATDLYQMQARWYDPQAALFTSPDPAMGDATDPTLRYPYAYCAGDPVYNSDPSGRRLIEGEDESGRLITWAPTSALKKYAARRGMSMSNYIRRKTQERKDRYNQMKARAKAAEAARPKDMSASTLERLQSQGIDPTALKQHLFPRIQDALGAGSYAEVTSIAIEMGESGAFTEQDVRYFISRTAMNQRMQEEYVNIFHQAEQGLYETPGIGEMLTRGETWKKATPGIILGVSIVVSIVATIATCGAAVSVIAPAGSTAAAVTAGSVGFAGTMTVASGAVGVGSYLYSDYEIQKAYEKGLITEKEADSLRIYATASSSIGAIFGNIIPGLPAFTNTAFNRRLEELKKGG